MLTEKAVSRSPFVIFLISSPVCSSTSSFSLDWVYRTSSTVLSVGYSAIKIALPPFVYGSKDSLLRTVLYFSKFHMTVRICRISSITSAVLVSENPDFLKRPVIVPEVTSLDQALDTSAMQSFSVTG